MATSHGFRDIQFLGVTNVTNRFSLKMMYLESCALWNYEADDTWMVTVRWFFTELWPFFVFLTSEIPILEQKYNINGRTVLIQSCYLDFLVFQGPYFVIHYFRNGSSHFERMTRTLRNACIGQQISVSSVDALIGTWMRTIHCLL